MAVDDSYTKALLHFDGTDTSTTITDESGKTCTAHGDAQLDTAQKKFGTASLLLDGTGDFVDIASSADFGYGTGDFAIDAQIYINADPPTDAVIAAGVASGNVGFGFHKDNGLWMGRSAVAQDINAATHITTGGFHHVAVTRASGTVRLFLDGTKVAEGAWAYDCPTSAVNIGIDGNNVSLPFNGWIDEVRISKGIARWTANFTPPTSAYASTFIKKIAGVEYSVTKKVSGIAIASIKKISGLT